MERGTIMAIIAIVLLYLILTIGTISSLLVAYKDYKSDRKRFNFGYYFHLTSWGVPFVIWWSVFTFGIVLFGISWWLSSFFIF